MGNIKVGVDKRLNDRLTVMENEGFISDYQNYCDEIGENRSQHIRNMLHSELALYEDAKKND